MGLFDLPAPLFDIVDGIIAAVLPAVLRLVLWGVLAGWVSMLVYRFTSNQERIAALKTRQQIQQKQIAAFDGEFAELLPLIRQTLALGFRQMGLVLGPALLATLAALFIIVWVAGAFGYRAPLAGDEILVSTEPAGSEIHWSPPAQARAAGNGWIVDWPAEGQTLILGDSQRALLEFPLTRAIPVIHKKRWWNLLLANPLGYLPPGGQVDVVHIGLPEQVVFGFGPGWMHGWMFSFFAAFLLSSFAFKWLMRLH
jgi:hypothetical protein